MSSLTIFDTPNLLGEQPLLDLTQAAREFPVSCSRSAIERWIRVGVRDGIRLETVCVGNRRFTTKPAIERFLIAQQNTVEDTPSVSINPPKKRNTESARKKFNLPFPGKNGSVAK